MAALRRGIAEDETKGRRLLRGLELVDEPDKGFIRDIDQRRAELREHRAGLERQLAELENEAQDAPNPDLLSRLPITAIDLAGMPDAFSRRLFEALRLEIHYDRRTNLATCRVTLTGETVEALARTTREAVPRATDEAAERSATWASFCVVPPAGAVNKGWSLGTRPLRVPVMLLVNGPEARQLRGGRQVDDGAERCSHRGPDHRYGWHAHDAATLLAGRAETGLRSCRRVRYRFRQRRLTGVGDG